MRTPIAAVLAFTLAAHAAAARVAELRVVSEQPFADGRSFGPAGPYVRVDALARGELDPADPALSGIALLAQAPRNARGMVEYEADVSILRPADPARGNGVLLYDVPNRGNKYVPSWINDAREPPGGMLNDPRTLADAGNGFTFRRGYTLAWSGWQSGVSGSNFIGIRLPIATNNGTPIVQRIRHEFQAGTRGPEEVGRFRLPYGVAHMDTARLTVRAREADPPMRVSRGAWDFMDSANIQLLPFGTQAKPRQIYNLTYEATRPTVDGIGFVAVRDIVSHLRQQAGIRHAIGFGVSLSGRFLHHFLDLGLNRDEAGRRVFDGVLAHIAGAGKVFGNEPFAMAGRTATQHEDRFYPENWPPFGYADGLLRRPDSDPLVIDSNTSTEYWQKAASLLHTTADGADAALHPQARVYLVPGTQHGGHFGTTSAPGFCANPRNPNSAGPALRAMLVNLEAWVVSGTAPPDSVVPRRSDGTGVPASAVRMPAVPGVTWASGDNPVGQPVDWVNPPRAPMQPYATLVPAVDADGNEIAGLRLPHVAAPIGTHTGVSTYRDAPTELCDRDGAFIPFARSRTERDQTGDPRPSLEERYGSQDAYVARVRAAADALVAARYLLQEDADRYVEAASAAVF